MVAMRKRGDFLAGIGDTDSRHLQKRQGAVVKAAAITQPVTGTMTEDYAIVTHVFDPATENTVISAAGIETYGTLAASEFITRPEYVGAALRAAPKDWSRKNVQFVLGTK